MDVYMQAAKAVQAVQEKGQNLKRLVLAKEVQKKRATFAVAAEALRHGTVIDAVLKKSGFFEANPTFWPALALVLAHDELFGGGLRCKTTTGAPYAVKKHGKSMKQALELYLKKRKVKDVSELLVKAGTAPRVPVYLRVNTLKATTADVSAAMERVGWKLMAEAGSPEAVLVKPPAPVRQGTKRKRSRSKKRQPDDGDAEMEEEDEEDSVDQPDPEPAAKRPREAPHKVFYKDPLVPDLLVFPPSAKFPLVKHPTVFRGEAIIQDKASCLPACVAMHRLPMVSILDPAAADGSRKATVGTTRVGTILDATAAPGNKTSFLCAMAGKGQKVIAVERDPARAQTLRERLDKLSAHAEVIEGSFMELKPEDFTNVECLVLDPSCSGSGMLSRILKEEKDEARVEQLADFQKCMLQHAMSFPGVRRVVYSTCSVHKEENEEVIRDALSAQPEGKWKLADVMPGVWKTRGLPIMQDGEFCVRCDPAKDFTQGFFLACLERVPQKKRRVRKNPRRGGQHRRHKTPASTRHKTGAKQEEVEVEVTVDDGGDEE
eukprot:TRINITY_DN10574_c0_g1_i1.p1 TRINITY_DN10574_c0_g1~~TRINITY_DN10574_c0_g1_i1.p1  ORF type:complete len:546 (+),score=189.08 TRINITY_DN10574_c0_g1_i1:84-1721(+)